MTKILHFADTHIDIAAFGKRDPQSGLPFRVLDFLRALDTIVDTAIQEKVDLVLFAGDAYKDRTPVPTYQREWGKRMMRLSTAGIPTLLLVGNHDLSPTQGRAHALQEFRTLQVPHLRVIDRPVLLHQGEFENLPLQIIAIPWVSRSSWMAAQQPNQQSKEEIHQSIEEQLIALLEGWLQQVDPDIPTILLAHASVQGALYGNERTVMLGSDFLLPLSLLKTELLDYVALGHIHKAQNLNEHAHPPIVYPGSIERVDFGEIQDEKYFVIAEIEKGETRLDWRPLKGRTFLDYEIHLDEKQDVMTQILAALPDAQKAQDALIRIRLHYPKHLENSIEEAVIREQLQAAFGVHLVRRPQLEQRARLDLDGGLETFTALDLLNLYWDSKHIQQDREYLNQLAVSLMTGNTIPSDKEIN